MRAARGVAATPTASQSGDVLGFYSALGYGASQYDGVNASGFYVGAGENHTNVAAGTFLAFLTTANGGLVRAEAGRFLGSGALAIGGTTDALAGGLYLNGQILMPNITTSSAAQNGTVCWTTGTGKFTVDTTVGCLTSIMTAKDITARLSSENALSIIDKLSPFAFRYKNGWGDSGHYEQFGLGAEEVALVDERLVGRDPEGKLQGVRYQELTAVLASAIQNLDKRIKQLEK